ncbi:hypothetical protein E3O44_09175 [Cryobacterium algoricola]|uniref:DUF4245 domain-containing protein n=1 Tax=Cryobacterium algoricola TaxID=1259183 RepID=A0ABY2IFB2_9MICO|nr:hypothetical protein [Cryobacterium algoricola]TFB87283.1 hypothetical protein E3O44_09175 [Cryobacterium algoricola]
MPNSRNAIRGRYRPLAAVLGAALTLLALSGCSLPTGRTDLTLRDGALLTQREVTTLMSKVPAGWLVSNNDGSRWNDSAYCGDVIETGPTGSAYWSYALAYDLTKPVANAELLKLLAPSGAEWVLRPDSSTASGTGDATVVDLYYDGPDMTVSVYLNGESPTRPHISVAATSKCIGNGETGPGTFPTPIPTAVPAQSAKP